MKTRKIIGVFRTEDEALNAVYRLKRSGYTMEEISVIAKDKSQVEHITDSIDAHVVTEDSNGGKIAGGAVTGGVIGGVGALLAELGLLAIPGVGPFLAAGPIAAALTGALAGGAVGGLAGALIESGVDKEEAKEYETYLDRGDIIVIVDDRYNADNEVYNNFYENNSAIRDRYKKNIYSGDVKTNNDDYK